MFIFKRKAYLGFFSDIHVELSVWPLGVYQLKVKYDQDRFGVVFLEAKCLVSFPFEDKHVVNEHQVVQKSHDATQKKCPLIVHFNVPHDWFETNLRNQKCYSVDGQKFVTGVAVNWEE